MRSRYTFQWCMSCRRRRICTSQWCVSYRRRRARHHALHHQPVVLLLLLKLGRHLPAPPIFVLLIVLVLDKVTNGHHIRSRPWSGSRLTLSQGLCTSAHWKAMRFMVSEFSVIIKHRRSPMLNRPSPFATSYSKPDLDLAVATIEMCEHNLVGMTVSHAPESTVISSSYHSVSLTTLIGLLRIGVSMFNPAWVSTYSSTWIPWVSTYSSNRTALSGCFGLTEWHSSTRGFCR